MNMYMYMYMYYGVEVNVAVDVIVDVLGEPEIFGGNEGVHRGRMEVVVAISSHCSIFTLTHSLWQLLCLRNSESIGR